MTYISFSKVDIKSKNVVYSIYTREGATFLIHAKGHMLFWQKDAVIVDKLYPLAFSVLFSKDTKDFRRGISYLPHRASTAPVSLK